MNLSRWSLFVFLTLTGFSCANRKNMPAKTDKQILVHGHRGARGLFPENTLTAFREAVNLGAPAIELDVVISADSQVVVSHEPWMHALYCSTPDRKPVKKGKKHNLYKMKYAAIRKYDCGIRGNKKFPMQEKISEHKPLLSEVIAELEKFTASSGLNPVTYNIEIKCLKPGDGRFHPKPEQFARLVYAVISRYRINDRILVQSFDLRVLQEIHKLDSSLRIGILTMTSASVKRKVKKLGFTPYMFNPHYKRVSARLIKEAHSLGITVHPYTVNDTADMRRLIRMGVDGLITDFPDKALKLLETGR